MSRKFRKIEHDEALGAAKRVVAFDAADTITLDRRATNAQTEMLLSKVKHYCYTLDVPHDGFQARAEMLLRYVAGRSLPNVNIYALAQFVTKYEMSKAIAAYVFAWGDDSAWSHADDEIRSIVWGRYRD
jgi:hypothetical protein